MWLHKTRIVVGTAVLSLCLSGCMLSSAPADTSDLNDLKNLTRDNAVNSGITGIRYQALQDTALGLGARAGLYFRAQQLNAMLAKREHELDRIFNFTPILLENNILPPVLIEARNVMNLDNETSIKLADRSYEILSQAHFISTPPTWRDYLWLNFEKAAIPDSSLLPKNTVERSVWRHALDEGWQAGLVQGDAIFSENIGRLKRDFNGMILYRTLLAQHMVSEPFVAKTNLGITGDSDELNINERVLKITAKPALQLNSQAWKTEVIRHD